MERILVIEENLELNNLLSEALRGLGYSCTQTFSSTEGAFCAEREPFHLAILDEAGLDTGSGNALARIQDCQPIPVLLIAASPEEPFQFRIVSKWAAPDAAGQTAPKDTGTPIEERIASAIGQPSFPLLAKPVGKRLLEYQGLKLDPEACLATFQGKEVPLTRQEFKILELLFTSPEHVFTKEDLYNYAWDDFFEGDEKTVNVHISNIRKKIKVFTDFDYIRTVWGQGFQRNPDREL